MLGAAFSTTSLPVALGLRIEKTALQIFLDQSSNWRSVARIIPAQSFREGAVVRLGMGSGFEKVGRDVELKTTFISEESSTYKIDTYGKAFHIARADLIDDSIGILNHIPMLIGNDSSKRIADTLFNTLTGTSATTGFFTSGDNSLLHDVLDFSGLAAAVAAMRTQKDVDGKTVGIQPTVFLVPAALEFTAKQLLNSAQLFRDQTTDLQPSGNPMQGIKLQSAIEARLDANSQKDWSLWSVPLHGAVLAAVLGGRLGRVVETSPHSHETLGLSVRRCMDWRISLGKWRAVVRFDFAPYS